MRNLPALDPGRRAGLLSRLGRGLARATIVAKQGADQSRYASPTAGLADADTLTRMTLRRLILLSHRWLGLANSLVLCIVGLTGAFLIWPKSGLIGRIAGPLHEVLLLSQIERAWVGWWIVVLSTMVAVLLQLGGLVLWWPRKVIKIRMRSGWTTGLADLHHAAGIVGFPLMLLIAVTGIGIAFVTPERGPELREVIFDLHTTRGYSVPIKVVYTIATLGFLVQGVSGVAMWWGHRGSQWLMPEERKATR